MAFHVHAGTFSKDTGGAPASQAVTGVGFTPKVIIFQFCGATANETFADHIVAGMGIAESFNSSEYAIATSVDGGGGTGSSNAAGGRSNDKCLLIIDSDGTVLAEADMSSYDSDGFTLDWTTNNATAYQISYIALGGTGITDANVVSHVLPTSSGDHSITGMGFEPDLIFNLGNSRLNETEDGTYSSGGLMFGWADGTNEAAQQIFHFDNDILHRHASRWTDSGCLIGVSTTPGDDMRGEFSSFDSDGVTFNMTAPFASTPNYRIFTLGLELDSVSVKIGTWDLRTDTGTESITGVGFGPTAGIFMTLTEVTVSELSTQDAHWTMGFVDRDLNVANQCHQVERVFNLLNAQNVSSTGSLIYRDDFNVALSKTLVCDTEFDSWDADGFTVDNVTKDDSVQDDVLYIVFATDEPGAGGITPGDGNQLDVMESIEYPPQLFVPVRNRGLRPELMDMETYINPVAAELSGNVANDRTNVITYTETTLYQSVAEPPPEFGPETVFPDKYWEAMTLPPHLFVGKKIPHQAYLFAPIDPEPLPDTPETPEEYPLFALPPSVFRKARHAIPPPLSFVNTQTDEETTADRYEAMDIPFLPKRKMHASLIHFGLYPEQGAEEEIFVDKWWTPFSYDFSPRGRTWAAFLQALETSDWGVIGDVEEITVDKYHTGFGMPVFPTQHERFQALLDVMLRWDTAQDLDVPGVTLNLWYPPIQVPIFPRKRIDYTLYLPMEDFPEDIMVAVVLECPAPRRRVNTTGTELRSRAPDTEVLPRKAPGTSYLPQRPPDCGDRKE